MKKALKLTFGTMLAVSMAAPIAAVAHQDWFDHVAAWGDVTYMKPSNNGLSVGDFAQPSAAAAFDGTRNHFFFEPESEFDYAFGISIRAPRSHHTRFFVSYDHTQNDNDLEANVNIRNLGVVPTIAFPESFGTYEYDVNAHEFRVGAVHDLHFGDHFCLDVLAFLEYDRLRQNTFETISQRSGAEYRTRETENLIKGFGPGFGLMSRWYASNPHWHVFAGANAVLLKMENEYSQTFNVVRFPGGGSPQGTYYDYQPFESDSIVGKLDINFGVNFHCAFKREMHGAKWDIALGMKYMNMFNVLKNGNTAYQVNGAANAQVPQNFAPYLGAAQDWGKWGPFLRFKLGGAQS
ncbi:MAG: hypothetical protein AB7V32_07520 [Candidatus Berkiella sp.]